MVGSQSSYSTIFLSDKVSFPQCHYVSLCPLSSRCQDRIRHARDLLGEMLVKDKKESERSGESLQTDASLTPVKERGRKDLGRKRLTLQHSSKKISARSVGSPQAKATC